MSQRFRKKPVEIEAVQWTGENRDEIKAFIDEAAFGFAFGELSIHTLEGSMKASPGDWIIRGVQGEHYPCKPDIFEATYDPA